MIPTFLLWPIIFTHFEKSSSDSQGLYDPKYSFILYSPFLIPNVFQIKTAPKSSFSHVVGATRLERATSQSRTARATNCATPRRYNYCNRKCRSPMRPRSLSRPPPPVPTALRPDDITIVTENAGRPCDLAVCHDPRRRYQLRYAPTRVFEVGSEPQLQK